MSYLKYSNLASSMDCLQSIYLNASAHLKLKCDWSKIKNGIRYRIENQKFIPTRPKHQSFWAAEIGRLNWYLSKSILLGVIVKQLKTFSPIQILSSGSISSTLYLADWGTIECRGLRATPWNSTWQRMFWFLNQIVESTDTFGTRFISDTSILKETKLDHSLFCQ